MVYIKHQYTEVNTITNPNSNEEVIVRTRYRNINAERVTEYVKEPLQETIHCGQEKAFLTASDDLLMLLVFTYIDLLGYLYKGSSKSIHAVEFIREYLGKVDQRYVKVGGLLYDALRHGMIHLATPKRIELRDGKILDFSFSRSEQREDYLKIEKHPETQSTGARVDIYRLTLNIPLLYKDVLSAIDMYAQDIRHNQTLSDVFGKAFETRRKPEKAKEEQLLNKPYIQDSDFAFVREQISKVP